MNLKRLQEYCAVCFWTLVAVLLWLFYVTLHNPENPIICILGKCYYWPWR